MLANLTYSERQSALGIAVVVALVGGAWLCSGARIFSECTA